MRNFVNYVIMKPLIFHKIMPEFALHKSYCKAAHAVARLPITQLNCWVAPIQRI